MELDTMPQLGKFMTQVSINNVSYGIQGGSTFRNSSIMFRELDQTSHQGKAALVDHIFIYNHRSETGQALEGIYFVVQELHPVDAGTDPYR
jgi:hypothetical protein